LSYVEEFFAVPTGLKPVFKEYGTIFYSSPKLRENFLLAFEKSSKGRNVASDIKRLVKKEVIIPVYKSKNLLSFLKRKLGSGLDKYILAYYSKDYNKVVVIIDNTISLFGTASNNELASTTMHECMHLAAATNLSKFVKYFYPYLAKYYSSFFADFFKLKKLDKKTIDIIIKYIMVFEKRGYSYANKELGNYYRLLDSHLSKFTTLPKADFDQRLTNMIVAVKLLLVSMNSLLANANKFSMVFMSLNRAYRQAFGEANRYSTPIQELISISEVASIFVEMKPKDPVVKKIFSII